MAVLHPKIIKRNGKKEYVILPYEEFRRVQEEFDNYQDLRCLREVKATEKDAPTIGMAQLRKKLEGRTSARRR